MNDFLAYCVPCALMGVCIGGVVSTGCNTKLKSFLCFVMVGFIVTVLLAGMMTLEHAGDERVWNDGHCECGGEWHLVNVSRYKNTTAYYWECEECLSIIDTATNPR